MKTCIRCGREKPLEDFYPHKLAADRHMSECKRCCCNRNRLRHYRKMQDPEWREGQKQRSREGNKKNGPRWNGGELPLEIEQAEVRARHVMRNVPPGIERHHWSYLEEHWADVILLTGADHRALHRRMRYDPETRAFRTRRRGHLLDTKAKHLRWIRAVLNERETIKQAA